MVDAYLMSMAVRSGDSLALHANDVQGVVSVRQWQHSDPNPRGPGVLVKDCDWGRTEVRAGSTPTQMGSWLQAEGLLAGGTPFTFSAWLRPTDLSADSVICSWLTPVGAVALVAVGGELTLRRWRDDRVDDLATGQRLRERAWHFVGAVVDASGDRVTIFSAPWGRTGGPFVREFVVEHVGPRDDDGCLMVGRAVGVANGAFDGNVGGARLHLRSLDIVELMDLMNGLGDAADHEWQFDDRSDPDSAPPVAAGTPALTLFGAPAWSTLIPPPVESTGRPLVLGGSIHLHRDDVDDCEWPLAATIEVPADAPSGFYSLRITTADEERDLPFLVMGSARVTLLVPTLTWQAYGNLGRSPEQWPGRSHYSLHSDGSPVLVTSSRRPCDTFSPHARLQVEGGDGFAEGAVVTHLMMADLYAWHWLVSEGVHPAVLDDRELHHAGAEALSDVDVLVLSAHPEYWTTQMLDALQGHLDRGGHVIYLGGNGLYWVTSLHPTKPHLMEVRRWGGSQVSSVVQVDRTHQYEPVAGGLWAEAGRPPNESVSVAFTGFGAGDSLEYERTEASYTPEWSWMFDGVEGPRFGTEGINTGAGNEFDRVDTDLPSPGRLTIVATAHPQTTDHFGVLEYGRSRAPHPRVSAHMVMAETEAGGLVFSTSAITASGCLVVEGPDAPLRRVVSNVLRRMLDSAR